MTFPLTKILILVFFFSAFEAQDFSFSFRSQYDGYVYPKWKKKGGINEHFYEDAVVVGKDFMVLGDGVGAAKGFSGIFSIHQCLNIALTLKDLVPTSKIEVTKAVKDASVRAIRSLGYSDGLIDIRNVATTLVYIKLQGSKLYSGVVGDSGFKIYRFDNDSKKLKLKQRSRETAHKVNTPFSVTLDRIDPPEEYEDDVKEGDIVMVASDGVLDVLPSSFITAATNYLVAKMIEKNREMKKNPIKNYNFDYDYDLADFVEGYVENLVYVSIKLIQRIIKNPPEMELPYKEAEEEVQDSTNDKDSPVHENLIKQLTPEEMKIISNKQLQLPKSSFHKIDSKDISDDLEIEENDFNLLSDKFAQKQNPDKDLSSKQSRQSDQDSLKDLTPEEKINRIMENIFKYEICNLFDPTENNIIFKKLSSYNDFELLTRHNLKHDDERSFDSVDCFRNKIIEKTTTHHLYKREWKCKDIFDLTYPVHPTPDDKGSLHNFQQCVLDAIPALPDDTTPEEIAEAFNSRYFARNIALAVKYLTNDPRVKADSFVLKYLFSKNIDKTNLPQNYFSYDRDTWTAKNDDVSIAAAAIKSVDNFDKAEPNPDPTKKVTFKKDLLEHSEKIESVFYSSISEQLFGFII